MSQVQGREIPPDEVRTALTTEERAELERLREENSALRTQPRPPRWHIRWRSVIAVVLLVVGCALAPVALVAVWTRSEVSDTDQFVETVGPLAADPAVQEALTNRITTTVFEHVDVQALANEAIDALAAQGLPPQLVERLHALTPTLASATTSFVREKVGELVASPQFAAAWDQAVRVAHQQAVTVLSGDSQSIVVQGGTVYLDLAPFIDALLVLALVVALGAFLAGPSATAVGVRRWAVELLNRIRVGPSSTGPVATWVRAHLRGLRIGAVALAALVFVFLNQPSGVTILIIAAVLLVVLGVIEFLGRPGPVASTPGTGG